MIRNHRRNAPSIFARIAGLTRVPAVLTQNLARTVSRTAENPKVEWRTELEADKRG